VSEEDLRQSLVRLSKSLYSRGFAVGSAGNISALVDDGMLITPTNSCLGFLEAARISKLDRDGRHVSGDKPSKEVFLHQAFYETRPTAKAVVHLHSTYATALSCLADLDPANAIPPITPYVVMRVGKVPLVDYVAPGEARMGDLIRALGGRYSAVLLANHGPVVAGPDLESAVYASEELEETAKLALILRGANIRELTTGQIAELETKFALR
jgi:ribulose-5-phosphate 4-epimerase/fuculose-1-phosphate aldolase